MRRISLFSLLGVSVGLAAQTPSPPGAPAQPTTIRTSTQLIVVDVTVQDQNGNPVHGLKASDFRLLERKEEQTLKSFEEHTPVAKVARPKMPVLPKGTFTDYSPAPVGSALNVILLDLLNTSITDQAYVLDQLKKYVRGASPASTTAIYVLNSNLIVLQGFTSDPAALKYAVDHKVKAGASILLDDASGAGLTSLSASSQLSSVSLASTAVANMAQAEADEGSFEQQYRSRATLEAFRSIASYLAKYPGRKNLVWFSGSFPFALVPDETLEDPFTVAFSNAADMRATTDMLDRARVAVYPIDARGLRTLPVFDAGGGNMATVNASATINAPATPAALNGFASENAQEHFTMSQMADDTGGRAYFNLNNFVAALTKAVVDGSNYYTLTYTPTNRDYHGDFRKISVEITDPAQAKLNLAYRHGYFAEDPAKPKNRSSTPILTGDAAVDLSPPKTALNTAMSRGGPAPSDILFTARVLPVSTATEELLAAKNVPNPDGKFKGPYRRVDVDFAVVAKDVDLSLGKDGLHHGDLEFVAYVYDVKGKLLNGAGDGIKLDINDDVFNKLRRAGIEYRVQVSVPASTESLLRIAVHDRRTGRVGALEIADSDVLRLPPLSATVTPTTPSREAPAKP